MSLANFIHKEINQPKLTKPSISPLLHKTSKRSLSLKKNPDLRGEVLGKIWKSYKVLSSRNIYWEVKGNLKNPGFDQSFLWGQIIIMFICCSFWYLILISEFQTAFMIFHNWNSWIKGFNLFSFKGHNKLDCYVQKM